MLSEEAGEEGAAGDSESAQVSPHDDDFGDAEGGGSDGSAGERRETKAVGS